MDLSRALNGRHPDASGACVLYWMQASQRAEDNPALNEAIRRANAVHLPIAVVFGLDAGYPAANARHFRFLLEGLACTAASLRDAGIGFFLRHGKPGDVVVDMAARLRAREVVVDASVLRTPRAWRDTAADRLKVLLTEVVSETVLPPWGFGRLAATAAILRPWVHRMLPDVEWDQDRPVVRERWQGAVDDGFLSGEHGVERVLEGLGVDRSVAPVRRFRGGADAAHRRLEAFVQERLERYSEDRARAEREGTSGLSAYLHFGQIGPHAVARAVRASAAPGSEKEAFLEQLLVRRELAWNLCSYNPDYDQYEGLPAWGLKTLEERAVDPRPVLYTLEDLEAAETHDPLWNAAQREMTSTGSMHNVMRMLWAKKILEWSPTPREAFERAVYLNDRYQLDGRDPNSYAGIGWAIGGRHDRPWPPRPIFGAVRYMSTLAARRKMNVPAYMALVEKLSTSE